MTDRVSVSPITDDMVERAAKEIDPSGIFASTPQAARKILEAALAGCTVVRLPEPDGAAHSGERCWKVAAVPTCGGVTAYVHNGETPLVDWPWATAMEPADAEAFGVALIAAAREARRLAAEQSGSQVGDQHG